MWRKTGAAMREEIKMLIQLQELDATVQRLKQTKDKLAMEAAEADRASAAEKTDADG